MEPVTYPRILPAAESSVVVEFGNEINVLINRKISGFIKRMSADPIDGILEMIPTFRSVLINYEPRKISYYTLCKVLTENLANLEADNDVTRRVIEIPVCYGGKYGPDLSFVAEHAGMSEKAVIKLHSSRPYLIYMLGFQPGFPYLGGLDPKLFTPRLETPRARIPAGSVGIGGEQTGLYPVASPAGWQIIGTTPVKAYNPRRMPSIPYEAGDHILFKPITEEEYLAIEEEEKTDSYEFRITMK